MSYKSDMEYFREQQKQRRALLTRIIKITVLALAAAILVTGVAAGVTFLVNWDSPDAEDEDGVTSGGLRIFGPENDTVTIMLGDKPAYKSFVTVSKENAKVTVDNSEVDISREGTYKVYYTATDEAERQASYTLTLVITKNSAYTEARLMSMIAQKAEALGITKSMSKEEQVRRIYNYVKDPSASASEANIFFSDESNAPSQKNQSGIRSGWETDWVEEAIRTLSMSRMRGDCYSYYAVSKALFEYFGIENIGIQRAAGSGMAGTHFWQVVNVGTKTAPKWYYYDATRLAGTFSDGTGNSCLITEEKLLSYKTSKGERGFYTFDKNQYKNFPKTETTPIS